MGFYGLDFVIICGTKDNDKRLKNYKWYQKLENSRALFRFCEEPRSSEWLGKHIYYTITNESLDQDLLVGHYTHYYISYKFWGEVTYTFKRRESEESDSSSKKSDSSSEEFDPSSEESDPSSEESDPSNEDPITPIDKDYIKKECSLSDSDEYGYHIVKPGDHIKVFLDLKSFNYLAYSMNIIDECTNPFCRAISRDDVEPLEETYTVIFKGGDDFTIEKIEKIEKL